MKLWIDRACIFLASGFGGGLAACALVRRSTLSASCPKNWTGAGLVGSLIGLAIVFAGLPLTGLVGGVNLAWLTALAVYVSGRSERLWNSKDDPRIIVDEIVGIFWTLAFIPWTDLPASGRVLILLSAFVLFRIFDVLKVPSRRVQEIPGGTGVVIDDVLAGICANLCLRVLIRFTA